jgi:hypothetical protein
MEKIFKKLNELDATYCTLSTIDDSGKPWGCPVFYGFDNEAIYWTSSKTSQHSINVNINGNMFISLFKENVPEGTGIECGLYLEGKALELETLEDITHARNIICSRIGITSHNPEGYLNDSPRKVYKFVPGRAWTNDEVLIDGQHCDARKPL